MCEHFHAELCVNLSLRIIIIGPFFHHLRPIFIFLFLLQYHQSSNIRVRTHWTDKICLALPKISTKFVSAKFSICQTWAH